MRNVSVPGRSRARDTYASNVCTFMWSHLGRLLLVVARSRRLVEWRMAQQLIILARVVFGARTAAHLAGMYSSRLFIP
jgi:hypothetical protein